MLNLGVGDLFVKHGSIDNQLVLAGLGIDKITDKILSFLN